MSETRAQYGEAGAPGQVQHTPGPWEALPNGNAVRTLFVPGSDIHRGELVADLYAQGQGLPTAEREATARLIAAAPDLLNIALRVVSALEDLEDDPPPRYRTRWHDLRDDARAALNHAAPAAEQEGE